VFISTFVGGFFQDVSMKYYTALLDEVPPELVSVSVILHCLVEQVAVYNCPIEDLEALEVAKANKQLAKDLENSFHKLGHGLSCMRRPSTFLKDLLAKIQAEFDQEEENARKMAKDQAAQDAAISAPTVVGGGGEEKTVAQKRASIAITSGTSKDKTAVTAVDHGVEPKSRGSKTGSALILGARLPSIAVDIDDSLTSSETTSISSQGSSTQTQENEEHLLVVQEFSRARRAATQFVMADLPLSFLDSVDVNRVEKHMLSLLSYPGRPLVRDCSTTFICTRELWSTQKFSSPTHKIHKLIQWGKKENSCHDPVYQDGYNIIVHLLCCLLLFLKVKREASCLRLLFSLRRKEEHA